MSPSFHTESIFQNKDLQNSFTRKDHNHMVIMKKRVSEDRNYLQPMFESQDNESFKNDNNTILYDKRIPNHRILNKTEEKPIDSFLFKLEQTLIENKLKWIERRQLNQEDNNLLSEYSLPEKSEFEFTFSKHSATVKGS